MLNFWYFRFGHSQIQGLIQTVNQQTLAVSNQYRLRTAFFQMEQYVRNNGQGMHEILKGLLIQPSLRLDRFEKINTDTNSQPNSRQAQGS